MLPTATHPGFPGYGRHHRHQKECHGHGPGPHSTKGGHPRWGPTSRDPQLPWAAPGTTSPPARGQRAQCHSGGGTRMGMTYTRSTALTHLRRMGLKNLGNAPPLAKHQLQGRGKNGVQQYLRSILFPRSSVPLCCISTMSSQKTVFKYLAFFLFK